MELLTGFLIGFLGSFHCIAMCGPIAIALPKTNKPVIISRSLYNTGRVITYSMLGLFFGLLGSRLQMFGLQQLISISLGILIILAVITPPIYRIKLINKLGAYRLIGILKSYLGRMFNNHSNFSMLAIGILNGLLPCGLVYIGITGAIAIGDALNSMLFMAAFGLGTMPIMLGTSIAANLVNLNIRRRLSKLIPSFSILLALIFILRGLNLGIPYLSPKLESGTIKQENIQCH
ncbi:MAG: sulfite exporter TauE/SafE family protein [Chlorobi bacterium]|nr:sulfite exporter TauE/SafE family protein [Chlorobiota bacterium]MCI0715162.1 sulfite exporter TauE/SafE family protein [Chlorobiota bacterium]